MTPPSANTADAGPAPRAAQLFWSRYFTVYDTLIQARPYQAMIARQIELLDPQPGDRALDAGTGSGNLAAALVRRGADVTGIACSAVLHVLNRNEQRFAVTELARVLRPGGRLVITAFAEGFSALAVYFESLRAERRAKGLGATVGFALRYSLNTARVLYYVWRIQRQQRRGTYAYVDERSLGELLVQAGLTPRTFDRTLAGQCVTALAAKPGATGR